MSLHSTPTGLSILVTLSVLGCQQSSVATEDPLTGTWGSDACFGSSTTPEDVERCSVELVFASELDFSLRAEWISLAATARDPGCTTVRQVTGQKWSTNHDTSTLTLTGSGQATLERSSCVNPEDNLEPTATSDIEVRPGNMRYEISDDTLRVLAGSLEGSYTR